MGLNGEAARQRLGTKLDFKTCIDLLEDLHLKDLDHDEQVDCGQYG